jgi:hypothetical protein
VIAGVCLPELQYITLAWGDDNQNSMKFNFETAGIKSKYQLLFLEIALDVSANFPNAAGKY